MMLPLPDRREALKYAGCTGGSMMRKHLQCQAERFREDFLQVQKRQISRPKKFEDYDITWHVDGWQRTGGF